jgi:hypothetical protein
MTKENSLFYNEIEDIRELLSYVIYASQYKNVSKLSLEEFNNLEKILEFLLSNDDIKKTLIVNNSDKTMLIECINFMIREIKKHNNDDDMITYTGLTLDEVNNIKKKLALAKKHSQRL